MFIPVIPVIHRPSPRFGAWSDSRFGANVLPVAGSGHPETDRHFPTRPAESGGSLRTEADRNEVRATGRKKREAAAQAKAEPTFLQGSGETGSPRAESFAKGHRRSFASSESDREPEFEAARLPKEGTRQGSEAGRKAGRGTRRNRNRTSNGPAKEPEGPTGAARPRPEPPWERRSRLRQDRRNQGQWRPAAMPASISFWARRHSRPQ